MGEAGQKISKFSQDCIEVSEVYKFVVYSIMFLLI